MLPVLRKDFTIDEVQVFETRAIGADAILLIVAALPDDAQLPTCTPWPPGLGLDVLVEMHDEAELERALAAGARVVGVNQRDLGSFDVDTGVGAARQATPQMRDGVVSVAESGHPPRRRAASWATPARRGAGRRDA